MFLTGPTQLLPSSVVPVPLHLHRCKHLASLIVWNQTTVDHDQTRRYLGQFKVGGTLGGDGVSYRGQLGTGWGWSWGRGEVERLAGTALNNPWNVQVWIQIIVDRE